MKWTLHAARIEIKPDIREHLDRRLTFALSRFASRIEKVDVFLTDQNGPKGGLDKSARVVVRTRGLGDLVAQVVDRDWGVTIDRVTSRLAQQFRRALERIREGSRNCTADQRDLSLRENPSGIAP